MTAYVTIGEFSRLTQLTVKTLHHYHDTGVLAPARIDPSSGYRHYATSQVPVAQLIRRLRELQLPLAQVREVVEARDPADRDRVLRAHLDQLDHDLARGQRLVADLRQMLELPVAGLKVDYRFVPSFRAYAVSGRVRQDEIEAWCGATFGRLGQLAAVAGIAATPGATYDDAFFTEAAGEVVGFLPVAPDQPPLDGFERRDLPAGFFAVAAHEGPFTDFDRTYGALGSHAAEHCEVVPGPIRELYVVGPSDTGDPAGFRTEICWPIQRIPTLRKG